MLAGKSICMPLDVEMGRKANEEELLKEPSVGTHDRAPDRNTKQVLI